MNEPLIENKTDIKLLAQELRELADRIEANGQEYFGGCFVFIPPQGGDVVKTLILDKQQDIAQYWASAKTKCDMALAGLDEASRNQRTFRGR